MKKNISYSITLICLLLLTNCTFFTSSESKTEEKFRNTITDDGSTTYGNYFTQLAGLRGEVKYSVFTANGETNPDIKIVQVEIDKKKESVKAKTAKLQYQFNEKTGFIKIAYLDINGEPQNLLSGSLILGIMLLELQTSQ